MHPESRVKEASTLVHKGQESLPSDFAANLPSDPSTLVRVTAAVQIAGGALLALGKAPRPAALALAATVVPATVTEQNFWAENDPERRAAKRTAFLKDVSLLGGLMIAASDTAGKPSLGWRGRRAARRAATTVGGALPTGGCGRGETVRHQLQQVGARGRDITGSAASRGAELAETAQERGPVWADAAIHRGAELADIAKHRGAELADYTKNRGSELAETAQHRGPEWAGAAKHRAVELADRTKHRGSEFSTAAKEQRAQLAKAYQDAQKAAQKAAKSRQKAAKSR